jgi:hypothetical protein
MNNEQGAVRATLTTADETAHPEATTREIDAILKVSKHTVSGIAGKKWNCGIKYEQDGKFLFGWLDDYPEYPTQGTDIKDLENHLLEIYSWIKDGTLEVRQQSGVLKVAV